MKKKIKVIIPDNETSCVFKGNFVFTRSINYEDLKNERLSCEWFNICYLHQNSSVAERPRKESTNVGKQM